MIRVRLKSQCVLRTKHGEFICRNGLLWELTYSEMGPPDQRQGALYCEYCHRCDTAGNWFVKYLEAKEKVDG